MWRCRWRCVIKPPYSVSFVLSINIFVWQNVLYFPNEIRSSFLISNFSSVLNVVCFLLGNSLASEFYMPMIRSTMFHLHRQIGMKNDLVILHISPPMKMELTECSEKSAYKIQTLGNYQDESVNNILSFLGRNTMLIPTSFGWQKHHKFLWRIICIIWEKVSLCWD